MIWFLCSDLRRILQIQQLDSASLG